MIGVVDVDLGHRELAEADHWILALDPAPVMACTHLVRSPVPHVTITLAGAGVVPATGRAVLFPGVEALTGVLTVAGLLAVSAIDRVEVLGGADPDPGTKINTEDFVRPQWRAGELVLTTTPAAGGRLVPFECRTPTPCCGGH